MTVERGAFVPAQDLVNGDKLTRVRAPGIRFAEFQIKLRTLQDGNAKRDLLKKTPPYTLRRFMTIHKDTLTTVGTILRKQGVSFKNGDEEFEKIASRVADEGIPYVKVEHPTEKGLVAYHIVPTEYTESVLDIARQLIYFPINKRDKLAWISEALRQRQEFLKRFYDEEFTLGGFPRLGNTLWERRLETICRINFTSDTQADLAREYGVTRKAVSQAYGTTMLYLYENAPEDVRNKYRREYIVSARKLMSVSKRRETSLRRGGSAVAVEAATIRGQAHNRQELLRVTGLSGSKIDGAISTAREWGVDIPKKGEESAVIKRKLDQAKNNDKRRQRILDKLTYGSLRGLARLYPDTFTNIREILRNGGFPVKSGGGTFRDVRLRIKASGIPMRTIPNMTKKGVRGYYNILLRQDEERLAILLDNDPKLHKLKTAQSKI